MVQAIKPNRTEHSNSLRDWNLLSPMPNTIILPQLNSFLSETSYALVVDKEITVNTCISKTKNKFKKSKKWRARKSEFLNYFTSYHRQSNDSI